MPKVVIELQANTSAAIAQIQNFAKAQRDTFDALRAGNPAIAESQIKISKLTESTKGSTEGFLAFDRSAKSFARGGVADLLHSIPIVGTSLAQLASPLKGFPLLLGGIVGAGVGVISWLKSMDEASTKALQSITALSEGMGARFQETVTQVNKIRAESAGDARKPTELPAELEIKQANRVRDEKVKAAQAELNTLDWLGRQRAKLSAKALENIESSREKAQST